MALKSLGKVTIASGGTPVRATANETDPTARYAVQSFTVQAGAANAGIVYVGLGSSFSTSTGAGVIGLIPKPASATTGPFSSASYSILEAPAGIDMRDIYIDGTTNDVVYISVAIQ